MIGPVLKVTDLKKAYGAIQAVGGVSFEVMPGEIFGVIGPNGSGKTTMINCISGALPCDSGTVIFKGEDVTRLPAHRRVRLGITRSFQIPRPFRSMSVLENLCVPIEYARREHVRGDAVKGEALAVLELVGFAGRADESSANLTQVDLRKLELARALAAKPALLVADEAMAGLSSAEVDDILAILFRLNAQGITIIMIEHIMRAVMRFSERIVVLDAGERIAEGTPEEIVRNPAVEKAYLGE